MHGTRGRATGYGWGVLTQKVDAALAKMKSVLDLERRPECASGSLPHRYEDKFTLVELAVRALVAGFGNTLEVAGLSRVDLAKVVAWSKTRRVYMRARGTCECKFARTERKVCAPRLYNGTVRKEQD